MPRFLRSPRWLAGHAVALVAVVAFVNLGLWQLRRLDERRTHNALVSERMGAAPVPLAELVGAAPADVAYRRVTATGRYRPGEEVLLSTRTSAAGPGHHVLTPLTVGGVAVVVDRGWVPLDAGPPPVVAAAPPEGEVTVEGILLPSQEARRSGALDGTGGRLEFVSDVDLAVLAGAVEGPLLPVSLLAQRQRPAQPGTLPIPGAPPELTEGSHLSYAGQWFLFALVVGVGYPLLLRRVHRDDAEIAARRPAPPAPREPPVGVG